LIWVLLGVVQARAQYYPESLEYLTDSSDLVVRARITSIGPREVLGPNNRLSISLKVIESLKGSAAGAIAVLVQTPADDVSLEEAMRGRSIVVWFLQKPQPDATAYELRDLDSRTYGLTFAQRGRRMFDLKLHPVYIEKNMIEEIKREATERPGRNDAGFTTTAPAWFSAPSRNPNGPRTITFPFDERIERLALGWVRPRTGDAWIRLFGVQVLSEFRSDRNVAILKAMANDPGEIGQRSFGGVSDYKSEAAKALVKWGVDVPERVEPDRLDAKQIASRRIRVQIDGKEVSFKDVKPPRLIGGRVYARTCTLSEALGVKMGGYDLFDGKLVGLDKEGLVLDLPVDSHVAWINDTIEEAPYATHLLEKQFFFPVRYIAEKLGASVKWNAHKSMVVITTGRPYRGLNRVSQTPARSGRFLKGNPR
jgi:hypothetical protein